MAKRQRSKSSGNGSTRTADLPGARPLPTSDYRHKTAKRKNNPPAKIAAEGTVPAIPKARYAYSPHLAPILRSDPSADADRAAAKVAALIDKAANAPLSEDDRRTLREALDNREPWLEWATKREQHARAYFDVDPVALHIHERVSAQAIMKAAARQDITHSLFADPEQSYNEAVQFYRHDIDWTNRLILGDSLQVMSSLARREDLAGKVQMIYMDPPYGIKYASNFQPEVRNKSVKENEASLTREPEMVRAYRDTWHLGVHSYLAYLRDRLSVARELLADSGSIFVQIGDDNLHRARNLLDEVFGAPNFVSTISFKTKMALGTTLLANIYDHLLWYAKDIERIKYHPVFEPKPAGEDTLFSEIEEPSGCIRDVTEEDFDEDGLIQVPGRVFRIIDLNSAGLTPSCVFDVEFEGDIRKPTAGKSWKTNPAGMKRLLAASRIAAQGKGLGYTLYLDDFPFQSLVNVWTKTRAATRRLFAVQTAESVIQRCLLMTTDPGDLVLDPTCGSGTTAYVAEQRGRRWITIDTSRVAAAIARQRVLTARFDYYRTKAPAEQPNGNPGVGLTYKTLPRVSLGSIAQNQNLDPIFAKHEPILDARLRDANMAFAKVSDNLRSRLASKLAVKQREEGKKAITDADRRRWILPPDNRDRNVKYTVDPAFKGWYHWEVPFDTDPDWPKDLQDAVTAYRKAWRAKMDEVNACINANAEQEELVDQPEIVKGVTRVSGPFTVEAVQPPEMSLSDIVELGMNPDRKGGGTAPEPQSARDGSSQIQGFAGAPDPLDDTFPIRMVESRGDIDAKNAAAYLKQMFDLLKKDGVRFLNNKQMAWSRLDPTYESGRTDGFHAEGRWTIQGQTDDDPQGDATVAVAFGPQYGPVTAMMVEDLIRSANRAGYDDLVIAGFSFDGAATAVIDEHAQGRGARKARVHMASIRPDVNPGMNGLLKEQPGSQLFTVFGQPRIRLIGPGKKGSMGSLKSAEPPEGEFMIAMEGVDIYDPVRNETIASKADKVAAWFLDSDYDGRTFCITQAFFPDRSAWEKLSKALTGVVDPERFEALSGTTSLPFGIGKHKAQPSRSSTPEATRS